MPSDLAASYAHCEHVAKTQARNFYYSFVTLPRNARPPCAPSTPSCATATTLGRGGADGTKAEEIAAWRAALERAFRGDYGDSLILPAFHDTVSATRFPARYFQELIDGTEMDLTKSRYETFEELHHYCYRVASVVGFVCIHVWGFDAAGAGDANMRRLRAGASN